MTTRLTEKYMIHLKAVTGDKYKGKLTFFYIARVVILQWYQKSKETRNEIYHIKKLHKYSK